MVREPNGQEPMDPKMNGAMDDLPEDPLLSASLGDLGNIQVPANFTPTVMYRVYESHHRGRIKWAQLGVAALVLALLCLGFFAADVADFQKTENAASYGEAWQARMGQIQSEVNQFFASAGSVVIAGWEVISGAVGKTSPMAVIGGLLLIAAAFYGLNLALKRILS